MKSGAANKPLKISYLLLAGSFILLFYSILTAPYMAKIPRIGRYFRASQIFLQAQHFAPGSLERQRLDAMAQAIWNGKNSYTFTPSPQTINMLQSQSQRQ